MRSFASVWKEITLYYLHWSWFLSTRMLQPCHVQIQCSILLLRHHYLIEYYLLKRWRRLSSLHCHLCYRKPILLCQLPCKVLQSCLSIGSRLIAMPTLFITRRVQFPSTIGIWIWWTQFEEQARKYCKTGSLSSIHHPPSTTHLETSFRHEDTSLQKNEEKARRMKARPPRYLALSAQVVETNAISLLHTLCDIVPSSKMRSSVPSLSVLFDCINCQSHFSVTLLTMTHHRIRDA